MIIFLVVIAFFNLYIFKLVGNSIKRLFNINFKSMNLIIGYIFCLFLFHYLNLFFVLNHYPFSVVKYITLPIYITIIAILIIFFNKKNKMKIDWFIILLILMLITYFFTTAFVLIGDGSLYLSLIRQNINSNHIYLENAWNGNFHQRLGYMYQFVSYELFVGTYAYLFHLDSTIFTVNIMTFIHIFIILYTNFELCKELFNNKIKARLAFSLFLLLFIFCNACNHGIFHPMNGYNFVYNIYSGKTIFLHAIIPLQFALLLKGYKNYLLLLLINLTVPAFTLSALFIQLVLNISIIFIFIYLKIIKDIKSLSKLYSVTILPLFFHYCLLIFSPQFNYISFNIKLIISLLILILTAFMIIVSIFFKIKINYKLFKRCFLITYAILIIGSIAYLIYLLKNRLIYFDYEYNNILLLMHKKYSLKLLVFHTLSIIALFKLKKEENQNIKICLFYLPIVLFILFINPFTGYFVSLYITSTKTYHRLFYLLPFGYAIIYVFFNKTKNFVRVIIIVVIVSLSTTTIFRDVVYLKETNNDFYYRIDKDVIKIGEYINSLDERYIILSDRNVIGQIRMISSSVELIIDEYNIRHIGYKNFENQDLIDMYLMINDKKTYNQALFIQNLEKYNIELVIIKNDKIINSYLSKLNVKKVNVGDYIIYSFL